MAGRARGSWLVLVMAPEAPALIRGKARPVGYMVKVDPEGGPAIGKYGAAGDIDPANQIFLENVPPGRYVIVGRPNPSSGEVRSEPLVVELKGGQAVEVVIFAK